MVSIQNMIAAEFTSAEICKRIAPDEAIAVGSAIEADILHSRQVDCDEKHLQRAIKLPTLSKSIEIQVRTSNLTRFRYRKEKRNEFQKSIRTGLISRFSACPKSLPRVCRAPLIGFPLKVSC